MKGGDRIITFSPHPPQLPTTKNKEQSFFEESSICQLDGNASFLEDEAKIPVHISDRIKAKNEYSEKRKPFLKTIKRNNLLIECINLPSIMNINPRSIYNKSEEFAQLVEQYDSQIICMSE